MPTGEIILERHFGVWTVVDGVKYGVSYKSVDGGFPTEETWKEIEVDVTAAVSRGPIQTDDNSPPRQPPRQSNQPMSLQALSALVIAAVVIALETALILARCGVIR